MEDNLKVLLYHLQIVCQKIDLKGMMEEMEEGEEEDLYQVIHLEEEVNLFHPLFIWFSLVGFEYLFILEKKKKRRL